MIPTFGCGHRSVGSGSREGGHRHVFPYAPSERKRVVCFPAVGHASRRDGLLAGVNARRHILLVQMEVHYCTASINAIPGSHTQLCSFPCSPARAFIPGHQPPATPDRYQPAGGAVLTIQFVCWQINAHFRADAGARSGSAGPRITPRMPRRKR